jgi:hypothetical protein
MISKNAPATARVLAQVDLAGGQLDLVAANDVGYVENFVPVDSKQLKTYGTSRSRERSGPGSGLRSDAEEHSGLRF